MFGTLIEFAVILVVTQKLEWENRAPKQNQIEKDLKVNLSENADRLKNSIRKVGAVDSKKNAPDKNAEIDMEQRSLNYERKGFFKSLPRPTKIDCIAFFVFNLGYILFNLIYFIHFGQN